VARERIASTLPLDESAMMLMPEKKAQPRVAFGLLVELGLIAPGTILTDTRRRWRVEVRADGSLAGEGRTGSIHKLGADLQGAPSCNGWTFWHYVDADRLVAIDELRQRHLAAGA
jgi:modification methylase